MKLKLIRDLFDENFTLGRMYIDDEEFAFTCEDAVRDKKVYGKTAIPKGIYKVRLTFSNRFQKVLPILMDVPNFEGVRIHSGNVAETETLALKLSLEKGADLPDDFEVVA